MDDFKRITAIGKGVTIYRCNNICDKSNRHSAIFKGGESPNQLGLGLRLL